jgi:hypothetical protein
LGGVVGVVVGMVVGQEDRECWVGVLRVMGVWSLGFEVGRGASSQGIWWEECYFRQFLNLGCGRKDGLDIPVAFLIALFWVQQIKARLSDLVMLWRFISW